MTAIVFSWILQLVSSIGLIAVAGFLIAALNRWLYRRFGNSGRIVCLATGIVGTPIHEGAHALMCLLFGHKITDIKFFQIDSADGTLGYVQHSYNTKSFYQRLGNLFIGTAPILVGGAVIGTLQYLLLPETFVLRGQTVTNLVSASLSADGVRTVLSTQAELFVAGIDTWQWWVFTVASALIAMHMTLSREDLKNAWGGLFLYLLILFAADLALGFFFPSVLIRVTNAFMTFGSLLLQCLLPAVSLLLLLIGATYAGGGIKRLIHR